MNYAATLPVDFFNEQGLPKEYRLPPVQQIGSMNILKKVQNNAIHISDDGVEIQHNISTSVPGSVPAPDFPFIEFPLTEVVNQSQIDSPSISDTLYPRGTSNSSKEASSSPDFQKKTRNWPLQMKK